MLLKSVVSAVQFRTDHFIYRRFKVLKTFSNWQVVSIKVKEALFSVLDSLIERFQFLNSKLGFGLDYIFVTWVSTSVLIFRNVIHFSSVHKCSYRSLNKGSGVEKFQFKVTKIQEIFFVSFILPVESRLEALLPYIKVNNSYSILSRYELTITKFLHFKNKISINYTSFFHYLLDKH